MQGFTNSTGILLQVIETTDLKHDGPIEGRIGLKEIVEFHWQLYQTTAGLSRLINTRVLFYKLYRKQLNEKILF